MTRSNRAREYLGKNPGATAEDLVNEIGISKRQAYQILRETRMTKSSKDIAKLKRDMKSLQKELRKARDNELTTEYVKRQILELSDIEPTQPDWVSGAGKASGSSKLLTPCVILSDTHAGEVVDSAHVFGKNSYDLNTFARRVAIFAHNTIDLLKNHLAVDYNGIVLCLNGDILSGYIHDELVATNDKPIMPSFLAAFDAIYGIISSFKNNFGRVFITATAGGNHSRTTKKIEAKTKAYTNFDWLLSRMLEKTFVNDRDVKFLISDGDDVQFNVYNHRFRQTHGDQMRGGHGFIGPFAPITRSETKKRTAAFTYGNPYDTLLIGHFHTLMFMNNVISNGSLIGYNEFALRINAPFEPPQQALFLVHPKRGITGRYPVFCEEQRKEETPKSWVSWQGLDR